MNVRATQFAVALVGMFFLGSATIVALVGDLFFDSSSVMTFSLVTALTGVTGAAAAYLFRLSGSSGGT
jgi:hypothetical protein